MHWTTDLASGLYQEIQSDPGETEAGNRAAELFEQRAEWWLPPAGNVPWRGRSDGVWTHSSARSGTGRSAFMASSSHQMAGGGDAMQSIPCF